MTVIKAEQSNKRQRIQQKLRCHRQTDYNGVVIYEPAFQKRGIRNPARGHLFLRLGPKVRSARETRRRSEFHSGRPRDPKSVHVRWRDVASCLYRNSRVRCNFSHAARRSPSVIDGLLLYRRIHILTRASGNLRSSRADLLDRYVK